MSRALHGIGRVALLVAAAALLLAGVATAQQLAAKKPTGKLEVTVAVQGGAALQSCTLYLKEHVLELAKGATTVVFDEVAQGRYALGADATVKAAAGANPRRVGVQPTAVTANKTTKVTVTLVEPPNMEAFCSGCHPGKDDPIEAGQIARDIHVSGKVLDKKKYLDQVAKHNAQVAQLVKQGKPHNLPIVLEKRKVVEGGKTVEREFYTCESCHTVHWERGDSSYARAPFRKSADLCQGCHP